MKCKALLCMKYFAMKRCIRNMKRMVARVNLCLAPSDEGEIFLVGTLYIDFFSLLTSLGSLREGAVNKVDWGSSPCHRLVECKEIIPLGHRSRTLNRQSLSLA